MEHLISSSTTSTSSSLLLDMNHHVYWSVLLFGISTTVVTVTMIYGQEDVDEKEWNTKAGGGRGLGRRRQYNNNNNNKTTKFHCRQERFSIVYNDRNPKQGFIGQRGQAALIPPLPYLDNFLTCLNVRVVFCLCFVLFFLLLFFCWFVLFVFVGCVCPHPFLLF